MSFFNELLSYFNIDDLTNKVSISMVLGVGLIIIGKNKIEIMDEDRIVVTCQKKRVVICGKGLKIKSVSKGEIIIFGEIDGIDMSEAAK